MADENSGVMSAADLVSKIKSLPDLETATPNKQPDQQTAPEGTSTSKEGMLPALGLAQATNIAEQPKTLLHPTLTPGSAPEVYRATQEKLGEKQLAQDIYQSDVAQRMDEAAKHNEVMKQLQGKLPELQKNVADTRTQHLFAETLDPDAMHREMVRQRQSATEPATPTAPLTRLPLGGAGTEKYATEFGALPAEAAKVPSMSVMQKSNIPAQAGAYGRISSLFPGENINLFEGYPLITLGEKGEKAVAERMQPALQAAMEPEIRKTAEEREREILRKQVAERKAQARIEHENAKDALKAHQELIAQHKAKAPSGYAPSEKEMATQAEKQAELVRLRQSIQDMKGKGIVIPSRSAALGSEYTNVYPISGANASYLNMLQQEMKNPNRSPEDIQAYQEEVDRIQQQMQRSKTEVPAIAKYLQRILPKNP